MLEELKCKSCGSNELEKQGDVLVCKYCGSKFVVPDAAKARGKKSLKSSSCQTTDPNFMESLKLCEVYMQLLREKRDLGCQRDSAEYEVDRLKEGIESVKRALQAVQEKKNTSKALTILVFAVWLGLAAYGIVSKGFNREMAESLGVMFCIWLLFFFWRILAMGKHDTLIKQYEKEIAAKNMAIKELEAKLPGFDEKIKTKQTEAEYYLAHEMGKCIIPEVCWPYVDEMRYNVLKGCTDLESALVRLAREHSEMKLGFKEKDI